MYSVRLEWPQDSTNRSRPGQWVSLGLCRITFWNSRYATGARLIAVPGCPLPVFCTASAARARMVSTALVSRSVQPSGKTSSSVGEVVWVSVTGDPSGMRRQARERRPRVRRRLRRLRPYRAHVGTEQGLPAWPRAIHPTAHRKPMSPGRGDGRRGMGRLVYTAIGSLDGYLADAQGDFGWAEPDPEVHAFVN